MPSGTKRQVHEAGHRRKHLVIVDESQEVESALFYSASRVKNAQDNGSLVLLYCIEPEVQLWGGVRQLQIEEQTKKAQALFRLFRRKLGAEGFDAVPVEEVIEEGPKVDVIRRVIERDTDIAVLSLGASVDARGPGPLVSQLAGSQAGSFLVPITVIPGGLTIEDIRAMA
jgi:nucleotide-binding universal stress UspA family protein